MPNDLVRSTWYTRLAAWTSGGIRTALSKLPSFSALRSRPTPQGGFTAGFVAGKGPAAESDLAAMATSPVVYAAVLHRALSISSFPVRCLEGYGMGSRGKPIDPDRAPWVASMMRVLQRPDPSDADALAPAHTGEALLAQVIADLILTGMFYVAPVLTAGGEVVGLTRLHPRLVRLALVKGEEWWVYSEGSLQERWYPRRSVFTGTLPSWSSTYHGELGVGAGTPLAPLVDAERTALIQTAATIRQGGADVVITGKDAQTQAMLGNKAAREAIVSEAVQQLSGGGEGRRVLALGGNLSMSPSGLQPADIKAPELLDAARGLELIATGTTPVAVGAEAGAYSEAVAQYRVQAEKDEQIASVIEAALFRPLARHFASRSTPRWASRADAVTARWDMSGHPGYASVRTDALNRANTLRTMGWTAAQAVEAEGIDMPEPLGEPVAMPNTAQTAPAATTEPAPKRPKGEAVKRENVRSLLTLFPGRSENHPSAWDEIEKKRAPWDARLEDTIAAALVREREAYVARTMDELGKAWGGRSARQEVAAYGAFNMDAILGEFEAAVSAWIGSLAPDWGAAWEDAAATALDHLEAEGIPDASMAPSDFSPLEVSARGVVDWTRFRVRATVLAGVDSGMPPLDIAAELQRDFAFDRVRAQRIARTDSAAAYSGGTIARGASALSVGAAIEQEWVSDPSAAQWPRRHDLMAGARTPVGGFFTYPSGISTRGPALSPDAGENANCRCAVRLRKVGSVVLPAASA